MWKRPLYPWNILGELNISHVSYKFSDAMDHISTLFKREKEKIKI